MLFTHNCSWQGSQRNWVRQGHCTLPYCDAAGGGTPWAAALPPRCLLPANAWGWFRVSQVFYAVSKMW